jgi:hypothetical protein
VGPEVAVGGPARPPRRQPCDGPPGRQRGADPGILEDQLEHHPPELRVLLAAAPVRLRSRQGQAAPRRGGLSERGSTPETSGAMPRPPP